MTSIIYEDYALQKTDVYVDIEIYMHAISVKDVFALMLPSSISKHCSPAGSSRCVISGQAGSSDPRPYRPTAAVRSGLRPRAWRPGGRPRDKVIGRHQAPVGKMDACAITPRPSRFSLIPLVSTSSGGEPKHTGARPRRELSASSLYFLPGNQ